MRDLERKLFIPDIRFMLILLSIASLFAFYLFNFTLFDGFSTLANDAAGYMLLARQWSPYAESLLAESGTWPVHTFPPGFPWVLAITGAAGSLYTAHLFVSLCMLAGIILAGWYAFGKLGGLNGTLLTIAFCLLPGVMVSSLGILSENLYTVISLAILLLYANMRQKRRINFVSSSLLVALMLLLVLTRSVGISMIMALAIAPFVDRKLSGSFRIHLVLLAGLTLALWQLWGFFDPQSSDSTYGNFFSQAVAGVSAESGSMVLGFVKIFSTNMAQIFISFHQYLSLEHPNPIFFSTSFLLFLGIITGLAHRLYQGKPDALYLFFYFGIILVWPYPEEMTRFLHPVFFLLILQAALLINSMSKHHGLLLGKTVIAAATVIIIINSAIIHHTLLKKRNQVIGSNPEIAHSYEYYYRAFDEMGEKYANAYTNVMSMMKSSAKRISKASTVAAVKHENYSILAARKAVNLVAIVPYAQQLCNLKTADVEAIFLSGLTTSYNPTGLDSKEKYESFSSEVWPLKSTDGEFEAYVIFIDKAKLEADLREMDYECNSFKQVM